MCIRDSSRIDPEGVSLILLPGVDNEALGAAVLAALDASRFVIAEPRDDVWIHPDATFDKNIYDLEFLRNYSEKWVSMLMERFGYKNRRALFKDLLNCNIKRCGGEINIFPTVHARLERWDEFPEDQGVAVSRSSGPKEIGESIRIAMSRCR